MKKLISILLVIFISNITIFPAFAEETKLKEINVEYQSIDEQDKININKLDKNNLTLQWYEKKLKKYLPIDKWGKISVVCYEYMVENCYPKKDNFDKNNSSIIKINLKDGDYVIINENIKSDNKKLKYAAEYDKNGEILGIVQIKTIKNSKKRILLSFEEYRLKDKEIEKRNLENIKQLETDKAKIQEKINRIKKKITEKQQTENKKFLAENEKAAAQIREYLIQLKRYKPNTKEHEAIKKELRNFAIERKQKLNNKFEFLNENITKEKQKNRDEIYKMEREIIEINDEISKLKNEIKWRKPGLTHVMFVDLKQKGKKVDYKQFIYKLDEIIKRKIKFKLICWQNNNNIYVDENNQNLIVKLKDFEQPEVQMTTKDKLTKTGNTIKGLIIFTGLSIICPIYPIFVMVFWDLFEHPNKAVIVD